MSSKIAKLLPLQNWKFVDDAALRDILIRDYRELHKLLHAGADKSAIIMCGSILEAIFSLSLSRAASQVGVFAQP